MKRGFTLIELLIVISIMGILSGVLFVLVNPASLLAKGRDARRLEDLDALNKAIALAIIDGELELDNHQNCSECTSASNDISLDGHSGWVRFIIPTGKTGLSKFLTALPMDPVNNGVYIYHFASTSEGYELNAVLESPDNLPKMTTDGGDSQERYEVGSNLRIIE